MIARVNKLALAGAVLLLIAMAFPFGNGGENIAAVSVAGTGVALFALPVLMLAGFFYAWQGAKSSLDGFLLTGLTVIGAIIVAMLAHRPGIAGVAGTGYWLAVLGLWALVWVGIDRVAAFRSLKRREQQGVDLLVPVAFGLWLIFLWEVVVVGFGVNAVLLPAPSVIAVKFWLSTDILWADFQQTFMKAVIAGYVMGCGSGFLIAIMVDRVPFLQRGLLPLGNMVSALPIVGMAPILVGWYGFDWQSKAAVVVIMTFFPMLVNTVTGLAEAGKLERELLQSYGASYWQILLKLRLPAAAPFIFNALKINSTLALIGAIVGEFFGTPIVGMGFRISTEVGRMNVDMVWAEIVVAALAGSAFYGVMALIERGVTFWHPSFRQKR